MKVYIRGLEKTSTIYLYGSGDEEVTEMFLAKMGDSYSGCTAMTDEIREELNTEVNLSDVKYVMSEEVFTKCVTAFERLQEVYDMIADEAYEHNKTPEELLDFMAERGIISPEQINIFMYY